MMGTSGIMTDPFTEWRKGAPYWLRDEDHDYERHARLLAKMQELQRRPQPKLAPNPLARTWHDE